MKKIGKVILSCVIGLSMALSLKAQGDMTTLIAPTDVTFSGTMFKADIRVVDFNTILSTQFTVNWDPQVLRYVRVSNFVLASSSETDNFGDTRAQQGMLAFSWFDFALNGRSLPDSAVLFSINFEVIGAPQTSSHISFTDEIAVREIVDASSEAITAKYFNGEILVASPVGTSLFNSDPHKISVEDNYPNPFHDYTQIRFRLSQSTKARVVVRNAQGQLIYEQLQYFTNGAHTLRLEKDTFPQAGTYYFQLVAPDFYVTQKLVFF